MNKNDLTRITNDAVRDVDLPSASLPAIDLYMDQIINLVAETQKDASPRFADRQLTKTMINNYSKDGLITPVKGKKYSKEQIVQMLTVYTLKSTLSINEIKRFLDGAYTIEGFGGENLVQLYDRLLAIKEQGRTDVHTAIDRIIDNHGLNAENETDLLVTIGYLSAMSAYFKSVAQALIDERYPEPISEDEQKEKDKEEEKKDKKEKKEEKKEKKKEKKEEKKKSKEEE